jgi:hypothetical protein
MRRRRDTLRGVREARARAPEGGLEGPQNLIHRNNSPKPVSMRVSSSAALVLDESTERWSIVGNFALGDLRWLMAGRRSDGST